MKKGVLRHFLGAAIAFGWADQVDPLGFQAL